MSKKLDETLAVIIQSVLAADPKSGRIGTIDLIVEDPQGGDRRLCITVFERIGEDAPRTAQTA